VERRNDKQKRPEKPVGKIAKETRKDECRIITGAV
jgi:hypothetical protein